MFSPLIYCSVTWVYMCTFNLVIQRNRVLQLWSVSVLSQEIIIEEHLEAILLQGLV
jgi:hypothetical protein